MNALSIIKQFNQMVDSGNQTQIKQLVNNNVHLLNSPLAPCRQLGAVMIHSASEYGYIDVMKCLVSNGVSINAITSASVPHRPIYSAIVAEQTEAVRWLLAHGAEVNYYWDSPHPYCSIIASTIRDGQFEYATMLVEAGAILNATDKNGRTPLDWAIGTGNQEFIQYLRGKGARTAVELAGT